MNVVISLVNVGFSVFTGVNLYTQGGELLYIIAFYLATAASTLSIIKWSGYGKSTK